MKKTNLLLALATTLVATSCSQDVIQEPTIPDSEKTKIEFSASDKGGIAAGVASTRAGFNGVTGSNGFNADLKTQIVARISSTDGTNTRHTRTLLVASPENTQTNASFSKVEFAQEGDYRYWDDAFGRDAKLSVYAIAVPNKNGISNGTETLEAHIKPGTTNVSNVNTNWKSDTEDNLVSWKVQDGTAVSGVITAQSATILENEDLCYSNNIQSTNTGGNNGRLVWGEHNAANYPTYSWLDHSSSCTHEAQKHDYYPTMDDGQMIFKYDDDSNHDGPGHFDRGHMIFKHALTRITIDIEGGDGFDYSNANSFTLTSQSTGAPATVDLLKMNTSGKLNIQTGVWQDLTPADHTYMSCGAKASGTTNFAKGKTIYTLAAQVLPGYVLTDGVKNNNVFTFNIDGNNYYVTEDLLYDALNVSANTTASEADGSKKVTVESGNKITLEQGKNYHFTVKVSKTAISELTCTLVDWVDVSGSFAATNAYITFESLATDVKDCQNFDLYRVLNLSDVITDPTHKEFVGTPQFMTGWADTTEPAYTADKLSTDGTTPGVTQKTAGSTTTSKIWQTTWFFETNKSFYHFRTVNPGIKITSNSEGDYFTMYSGPVNDTYSGTDLPSAVGEDKYNDYHWGAIYKPSTTSPSYNASLTYDISKGFEDKLAGPVGPTTSTLNLIEQHMMSDIKVVLLTPANSDGTYTSGSVDLYDETKTGTGERKISEIKLTNYAGSAQVKMGNGLITPTTTYTPSSTITAPAFANGEWGTTTGQTYYLSSKTYQFTGATGTDKPYYNITNAYTYRVVPQALVVGTNKVGLTIQTPDNNMYYVVEDLSKIKVSGVSDNALKNDYAGWNSGEGKTIDRWLPGYRYTYYFILTKTGIQALTCTIVDWVEVTGNVGNITLEN